MDFYLAKVIISFLTGGFLIFLALTVTRDNFTSRLNRVTGALFFFAGLGALFIGLGAIIERSVGAAQFELSAFYDLHYLYELLFPLLLFLSWIFPIDRFKTFRRRRLRFLIFVPQVMHLVLLLAFQKFAAAVHYLKAAGEEGGFGGLILRPLSEIASLLFLMVGLIQNYQEVIFGGLHLLYLAAAAYFFETGKKLVSSPTLLTQTRLVAWGIRVAGALYTAALISSIVAPKRFSPDLMAGLLLAALLAWSAMLIIATIRHQFLNVRLVLRQSFVYTITSGLLVGTYVVIVVQSKKILTPMFGEQAEMISYALIVLVLMLFQPINNWIDNVIRAMFIRTRTDPRNVLERFSRQVISLFDPEKLRQIIEETLKTTLLVEHVHFVLFDDRVGEYAIVPGEDHPRRIVLERDDLMLRGINLLDTPTYMHSLADYREGSPLATFLDDRRARLILPLKDANSLLGFVALSDKAAGYRYSTEDINLLGVLSNQMVSALTNSRLYVESLERLRLQEEVTMARQIQLDLLPSAPPTTEAFVISAQSTPSRTVGGDFYDFITVSEKRLAVVIADASGKGMPAALMIAQIQAMVRSEVNNGSPISAMLKNVNKQILRSTSAEKFATLFYGELDTADARFCYANAGHNYPILVRRSGQVELLKDGGPVIGAFPHMEYKSSTVQLEPEDILFLFTDGLSEALNAEDHEYGEQRISDMLVRHRNKGPQEIVNEILNDMYTHDPSDPPRDDTTIIAIKMNDLLRSDGQARAF